ncbi:BatD family protein [Flavobacterium sp. NRK F10]|uniref:BatD family protein n=1 Tax=Flavobacterium sp. NRK F10 TaxID=2954931 RepID=UPI00209008DD|nr:BatD family protein [Flavobacterium sp. NRK F10]MCO6174674.1 BatD family protein [Flavobacterium sp. NRK F10]
MKTSKKFNVKDLFFKILSHRAESRCLIIFFFFISSVSFSQSITSSVDSTQIKIGSQFNLTIKAQGIKSSDKVVFPEGQFFGPLEIVESYPVDTVRKEDKLELIKKYGLTQFDSGRYVVPPLQVVINNKITKTDSFAVVVNNVVVDTLKQQLYDIKPIVSVEEPFNYEWLYWILALLAIAAIGFGLYYFIKNRQDKQNKVEEELFASPIEKALNQLQVLEKKELWQKGETKAYYSELTDITRTYIEEAVEVPAMESTSGELYESLIVAVRQKNIKLNRETLERFKRVMATADLVKFAKSKPLDFEIENDKRIIDSFLMSLDKAIPRTDEEAENQFAEELKRKKEKKQKVQRLAIPLGVMAFLMMIVLTFFFVSKGTTYIRDKWVGHSAKSLLEGEWVTSDYGDPAIIVSTPKVLKRIVDEKTQNNLPAHIKGTAMFSYGSLTDNFSITLKTIAFKDTTQLDISQAAERELRQAELLGAHNMVVQTDDYEDPKGITGKRAQGTFTALNQVTKEEEKMKYMLLVFAQKGGAQILWLISREDDQYATEVMDKVLDSVELKKAIPND